MAQLIANILGLTDTVALFANGVRFFFFRFRVFFSSSSLKTEVGNSHCFCISDIKIKDHVTVVKVSERNQ